MITVFTPTFNRESTLRRLYESLLCQTNKNFEWLIVDDGSRDGTEELINTFINGNNDFNIAYYKQPNGGKHRAINFGVHKAKGELFFIVDSDDYLTEDAIESLYCWSNSINDKDKFAGVSGLRGYNNSEVIGGNMKKEYIDATNIQRGKFQLDGDKAEAYFTDVLKRFPFPEIEGEKFLLEAVVWDTIALNGYKIRWFNKIIYITEYLEGGLTKSGDVKYANNPLGLLEWAKVELCAYPYNIRKRLGVIRRYYNAVKQNKSLKEIASDLGMGVFGLKLAILIIKLLGR